jgi:Ca2+-transporting ATPase
MAKKNALCKDLTVVETIGNATVICSDKTGTLTLNKMTVTAVATLNDIIAGEEKTPEEIKEDFIDYKHIISCGMFCNNAELDGDGFIGDPTEAALLVLGSKTALDVDKTRNAYKRNFEQPFDSVRKMMSTVYKTKKGYVCFTKGAAEALLDRCNKIEIGREVREISEEDKVLIKAFIEKMSAKALRVLGLASKVITNEPQPNEDLEFDMTFLGLVGMIDPPREEVFDAIETCHNAGVKVAMITGDHQITALAIAQNLGIIGKEDNTVILGTQIDQMDEEQLQVAVKNCCVYARVSPDNKLRIVKAFKNNGEITGMTGDGTNDAPALKEANIGIAMGISGTDVAKGAASILLLDDNFTTIKTAINDGRVISRNIKNVINFILSTNFATALFVFLYTYVFGMNPINITQRLLLDLVTDTLPCIFIGLNINNVGIMSKRSNKNDKLLDKNLIIDVLINTFSIFIAVSAVFLTAFLVIKPTKGDTETENLVCCYSFIALSLSRLLLAFNYVSREQSIFSKEGRVYKTLFMSACVSIILLLILVLVPGLNIISKSPNLSD